MKLFSVSFEAPNDGIVCSARVEGIESAPTEVALYANIFDISFSDIDNLVPTEVGVIRLCSL